MCAPAMAPPEVSLRLPNHPQNTAPLNRSGDCPGSKHRSEVRAFAPVLVTENPEPEPGFGPKGSGADRDALLFEQLLQLAGLEHLANDVAAADELALYVELRDR